METIINIVDLLIFGLIISTPILLLFKLEKAHMKRTFLVYLLTGLIALGIIIFASSWWSDKSDLMLLRNYGYNIDGTNDNEMYGNVLPSNMEQVKRLETSIMGIGWPLKAIFGYIITIPYLIFVYLAKILINRLKNAK